MHHNLTDWGPTGLGDWVAVVDLHLYAASGGELGNDHAVSHLLVD